MAEVVEFIRFEVKPQKAQGFLEQRALADAFLQEHTPGFLYSELFQMSEREWLALIRWASEEHLAQAQPITATAAEITRFVGATTVFASFEQGVRRYSGTHL